LLFAGLSASVQQADVIALSQVAATVFVFSLSLLCYTTPAAQTSILLNLKWDLTEIDSGHLIRGLF
jgi:hypothetical protein